MLSKIYLLQVKFKAKENQFSQHWISFGIRTEAKNKKQKKQNFKTINKEGFLHDPTGR